MFWRIILSQLFQKWEIKHKLNTILVRSSRHSSTLKLVIRKVFNEGVIHKL